MCVYGCVRVYARVCACLYVFVTSMHVISDVTNAFSGCPTHVLNAADGFEVRILYCNW